jgi:hypothetical protein
MDLNFHPLLATHTNRNLPFKALRGPNSSINHVLGISRDQQPLIFSFHMLTHRRPPGRHFQIGEALSLDYFLAFHMVIEPCQKKRTIHRQRMSESSNCNRRGGREPYIC